MRGAVDGASRQLHQVVDRSHCEFFDVVRLMPAKVRAMTCRHALGQIELLHRVAQFLAVFAFNAARNATPTGVVGHQDQIAACQGNEGGQGGALVATLFFFDLDDDFLAFAQGVLDAASCASAPSREVSCGRSFEGQWKP